MSWVLRLGIGLGAVLLTCVLLAIFGGGGCSICGGISRDRVAGELSRYVTPYEARMIVNGNPSVKHYDSVEALKSAVKDKTLYQDSDFGVCRMEYTVL